MMTWMHSISGFGGICGLYLGISFDSLSEILDWFSKGEVHKKVKKN